MAPSESRQNRHPSYFATITSKLRSAAALESTVQILIFLTCLAALLWRFHYPSTTYLSFFTDDFFYYAVVARSLVAHGTSTFNGLQLTNGYHPLWMLTIAVLYKAFVRSAAHARIFFVAVTVLIWLLIVGSFRTVCAIQRNLGLSGHWYSFLFAIWTIVFMAVISRTGMEISLALFFLLLFWKRMSSNALERQSLGQAFISGLLASFAILSRIDCVIAILLYLLLTLAAAQHLRRALLRPGFGFAAGLTPVIMYIATNIITFHTVLPVSGMAKNLKPMGTPASAVALRLFRIDNINLLFTWPALLIALAFVVITIRASRRQNKHINRVQLCILAQPLIFYAILTMTSDWPLWTWYLYVLVPLPGILAPTLFEQGRKNYSRSTRILSTVTVLCLSLISLFGMTRLNPEAVSLYNSALAIKGFALNHPGTYAMGDRAGTPAWMIDQPIVQLEGLVEDKPFLNHIRNREALGPVLNSLGVDYYISAGVHPKGHCFSFREPYQAGPTSPSMKGTLCEEPLLETDLAGRYPTYIFKVGTGMTGDWQ